MCIRFRRPGAANRDFACAETATECTTLRTAMRESRSYRDISPCCSVDPSTGSFRDSCLMVPQ